MKKGLINIILLVLAITNIVLTAIMVFAVVPAMNSANDLVSKVSSAINLEKENQTQYTDGISIDNLIVYNFESKVTVALSGSSDDNVHYAQFGVTLSLDKTAEGYNDYKDRLATDETRMITTIQNVVSKYTITEIQNNQAAILEEITLKLREMYNNTMFIYDTAFVNIVFQ
ncbi:MAG: flagellar basal body-associated FliL family protein [Lachnospiraceae bacterium]